MSMLDKWIQKKRLLGKNITLDIRKVFILPTKAGIGFICLLATVLLVGINYQSNLAYALCFLMSSIFLLGIFHTCRNLSHITLANAGASAVFVGDLVSCHVKLSTPKGNKQAINVSWNKMLNEHSLVDVSPLVDADVLLTMPAEKRGLFYSMPIRIETTFPFGFFISWAVVDLLFNAVIYPKPIEGKITIVGRSGEDDEGAHARGRGVDDFQGLKSYQPGDSMRLVNWKSFSKGQGILVKDFSALVGKDNWLDFDQVEGGVEQRLSVLCYWVLRMEQQQQLYGLKLPNYELSPSMGEGHKQQALYALATYGITDEKY